MKNIREETKEGGYIYIGGGGGREGGKEGKGGEERIFLKKIFKGLN